MEIEYFISRSSSPCLFNHVQLPIFVTNHFSGQLIEIYTYTMCPASFWSLSSEIFDQFGEGGFFFVPRWCHFHTSFHINPRSADVISVAWVDVWFGGVGEGSAAATTTRLAACMPSRIVSTAQGYSCRPWLLDVGHASLV